MENIGQLTEAEICVGEIFWYLEAITNHSIYESLKRCSQILGKNVENYCVAWECNRHGSDMSFNRSGRISLRREEEGGREGRILKLHFF